MLQPDQEGEIPFKTAIKCARAVLMNKIVATETDLVGIVLYGTVYCHFCSKERRERNSGVADIRLLTWLYNSGNSLGEIKEFQQLREHICAPRPGRTQRP